MGMRSYDCCGYATRYGLKCADGKTILPGAFAAQSGEEVPVVWNHQHNDVSNVLGHALLQSKPDGMYAYVSFNDTPNGLLAKKITQHKDIGAFSIAANDLRYAGSRNAGQVQHGKIREVSLVLAGANPGAAIEDVVVHGDTTEEILVFNDTDTVTLEHGEVDEDTILHKEEPEMENEEKKPEEGKNTETKGKTVKDVIDSMTEEQKIALYAIVGQAKADAEKNNTEEEPEMKHNVFDNEDKNQGTMLTHADAMTIIGNAQKGRLTLKEACQDYLEHGNYGVENIDQLFPDYHEVNTPPKFIDRDQTWVGKFMGAAKHLPFARVKTTFADITADEARAKGYVKGKKKVEEVIKLAKRTTDPQTVYKKQKFDRDDVVDITDFDVVTWIKGEMRGKLNEEIARAGLIGDGRGEIDEGKIEETHIRPIWTDADLFVVRREVKGSSETDFAENMIDESVRARKDYRGSGNPTLFTSEDELAEMLLLKDMNGRRIYKDVNELATAMRVKEIVTVPQFSGLTRETVSGSVKTTYTLHGIIVNPADYSYGADKGGNVSLFDDFNIDYNQMIYLIETRCSGCLTVPKSAIVLESKVTGNMSDVG